MAPACVLGTKVGGNPDDSSGNDGTLATTSTSTTGGTLETGVTTTLETGVTTLETGVTTLETGVTTLETGVTTLETGVTTLDTTMTGDPVDACDAGMMTPHWPWPMDIEFSPFFGSFDIDEPCTLMGALQTDSGLALRLDCPKWAQGAPKVFEFTIVGGAVPATLPKVGTMLDVRAYRTDNDIGTDYLSVVFRHEGALLYAFIYEQHLVPPEVGGPEIFAPLALSRTDHCPLVLGHPEDDLPGGDNFVCDLVGRARLHVAMEGAADLELADGEAGSVSGNAGTYAIDVKRAWRVMDCQPDYPPGELEIMAFTAARQ